MNFQRQLAAVAYPIAMSKKCAHCQRTLDQTGQKYAQSAEIAAIEFKMVCSQCGEPAFVRVGATIWDLGLSRA